MTNIITPMLSQLHSFRKGISISFVTIWFIATSCSLLACGKFANPIPPEKVSPNPVEELEVIPELHGIHFKWKSPKVDQRGKELKFIDGYRIYRKALERESDLLDESVEYELLAAVEDTHLVLLKELRDKAIEEGRPSRFIKVDEQLTKFEFTDIELKAGKAYAYQIIPINQGGVEGAINQIIRIVFRGSSSEVLLIPVSTLEDSLFS